MPLGLSNIFGKKKEVKEELRTDKVMPSKVVLLLGDKPDVAPILTDKFLELGYRVVVITSNGSALEQNPSTKGREFLHLFEIKDNSEASTSKVAKQVSDLVDEIKKPLLYDIVVSFVSEKELLTSKGATLFSNSIRSVAPLMNPNSETSFISVHPNLDHNEYGEDLIGVMTDMIRTAVDRTQTPVFEVDFKEGVNPEELSEKIINRLSV